MSSSIVAVPHCHPNVMTTLALATILVVALSITLLVAHVTHRAQTSHAPNVRAINAPFQNSWSTRTGRNQMCAGRRPVSPSTGDRSGAYQKRMVDSSRPKPNVRSVANAMTDSLPGPETLADRSAPAAPLHPKPVPATSTQPPSHRRRVAPPKPGVPSAGLHYPSPSSPTISKEEA